MQEFLSGTKFEQMAKEYNAKYGKTSVLTNGFDVDCNLSKKIQQEKEKIKKEIENQFEKISSLFFFTKACVNRVGVNNINGWQKFYILKLEELEKNVESLRSKVLELIK